jgi:hypothetical protein
MQRGRNSVESAEGLSNALRFWSNRAEVAQLLGERPRSASYLAPPIQNMIRHEVAIHYAFENRGQ